MAARVLSATFNRPADTTAYGANDLVANSTSAGSVAPMQFTGAPKVGSIRAARLKKTSTTVTAASFRLFLFASAPVPTVGDNAAFATSGRDGFLGFIDLDASGAAGKAFTDGVVVRGVPPAGQEINFHMANGARTIYGLIQAVGAYVPANAETFKVELEIRD